MDKKILYANDNTSENLEIELVKLEFENKKLKEMLRAIENRRMTCSLTQLKNNGSFQDMFKNQVENALKNNIYDKNALILISIDNLSKIKYTYGDKEVDETLKAMGYLLRDLEDDKTNAFRIYGGTFAITLTDSTRNESIMTAENIRNKIAAFEGFIEKVTVSIGVVSLDDIFVNKNYLENPDKKMYDIALARVGNAKNIGMNMVCSESGDDVLDVKNGKVLIADTDVVNVNFLKEFLENNNLKVFTANDGLEALKIAQKEFPTVIISDIILPKVDGFLLREKLMEKSITKNITFIIISHLKNEDTVKRALSLDIDYYFKKPYMLTEIVGIVRNKIDGVNNR